MKKSLRESGANAANAAEFWLKNRRTFLAAGITVLALIAFAAGIFLLPETLAMQIQADGSIGTVMPKWLGLSVALAISAVPALLYGRSGGKKFLLAAVIGLVLFAAVFLFNL